jgi:hypothetical protein
MAIEAVVRKLLTGERPAVGARSGVRALELADYDALFRGRKIFSGFRDRDNDVPLYGAILGSAFTTLSPRLQELHGHVAQRQWSGLADVKRGGGTAAALVAALIGFPKTASQVPVTVTLSPENGAERWVRNFGGKSFTSMQSAGKGKDQYLLVERFGLAAFALALVVEGGQLFLVPRRWSFLGIPMPRFLLPTGRSFETERDGQFCFDVEISVPFIGLIVAYKGSLQALHQPKYSDFEQTGPAATRQDI